MNKKVAYTKRQLLQALWSLLQQKSLQEVTVTELCRKAEINRTTFYRHFSTPHDVLAESLSNHANRIFAIIAPTLDTNRHENHRENEVYPAMLQLCQLALEQNQELFEVLRLGNNTQVLTQAVTDFMARIQYESYEEKARQAFFLGGITALYSLWCQDGFSLSAKEMARLMSELIRGDKKGSGATMEQSHKGAGPRWPRPR